MLGEHHQFQLLDDNLVHQQGAVPAHISQELTHGLRQEPKEINILTRR